MDLRRVAAGSDACGNAANNVVVPGGDVVTTTRGCPINLNLYIKTPSERRALLPSLRTYYLAVTGAPLSLSIHSLPLSPSLYPSLSL